MAYNDYLYKVINLFSQKHMKKIILAMAFLILLGVFCSKIPFSWFQIKMGMSKTEVYHLCGLPSDTDLWDIKGEFWEDSGPLWTWSMYVGLAHGYTSHSYIGLDLGKGPIEIRIHMMSDGEWTLYLS